MILVHISIRLQKAAVSHSSSEARDPGQGLISPMPKAGSAEIHAKMQRMTTMPVCPRRTNIMAIVRRFVVMNAWRAKN